MFFKQKSIYSLKLTLDLVLLNIVFIISGILAQSLNILLHKNYLFILLFILNFIWYFSANVLTLYEDLDSPGLSYQFFKIVKSVFIQALACISFIFITKENLFTRNFIVYFSALLTAAVFIRLIVFKKVFSYLKSSGKYLRNLIIIGAGELGNKFLEMIKSNPEYGYNFVGFVTSHSEKESDKYVIGNIRDLSTIIPAYAIEEAVIALPNTDFALTDEIIKTCNKNAVRAFIIPDYFKFLSKKFSISRLGSLPIITVRNEPLEEIQWQFVKRTFDFTISLLACIAVLSWLFPIIFILQKMLSRGPIFYNQDRIGKENKMFRCFKFRTMYMNSDAKKYTPTENDDPRVTKFGRFLRKSNLDELPQIINVLIGNMSLVGPRPHSPAFNNIYKEIVDEIKLRQLVKPGITGWAQVNGLRGDVQDEEANKVRISKRIEADLWYIENWSLGLDIQIIFLTVWQMLRGKTKGH
jgi:putative colanic acid biosysnthesis UDP-glucose lipid carrier transferase